MSATATVALPTKREHPHCGRHRREGTPCPDAQGGGLGPLVTEPPAASCCQQGSAYGSGYWCSSGSGGHELTIDKFVGLNRHQGTHSLSACKHLVPAALPRVLQTPSQYALHMRICSPAMLQVTVRLGSTCSHTMSATARPATMPSALARKVAVACVDSGILLNGEDNTDCAGESELGRQLLCEAARHRGVLLVLEAILLACCKMLFALTTGLITVAVQGAYAMWDQLLNSRGQGGNVTPVACILC
jgi:hypothetical protein